VQGVKLGCLVNILLTGKGDFQELGCIRQVQEPNSLKGQGQGEPNSLKGYGQGEPNSLRGHGHHLRGPIRVLNETL